jgi:uncharacterized protein (TIGR01244 family)
MSKARAMTIGCQAGVDETPLLPTQQSRASTRAYLDLLLKDHGILRLLYINAHRLGERAWRSAQPAPRDIRSFARRGVRTVINLRGPRRCGSYQLEREACERCGVTMIDFHVRSRRAPTRTDIEAARELFERVQYPILMHCKSGADRTGLMSVLYCTLKENVPLIEAKRQLSLRYGHMRCTRAGVLDSFFERYLDDNRRRPMSFIEWVEKVHEPQELMLVFRGGAAS